MTDNCCILYVQHAPSIGGSVVSLKEVVVDSVKSGHRCVVICVNDVVARIYREVGAATFIRPIIALNHNTALEYRFRIRDLLRVLKVLLKTMVSFAVLLRVVIRVRPNIVHLNSSTLILYVLFFRALNIPCIYHVRECVVNGHFGLRKYLIRLIANKFASFIIYISEHEYQLLKTTATKSIVIYNYVHRSDFLRRAAKPTNIGRANFKVISLGGLFRLKGGKGLLQALEYAPDDTLLLILGSDDPRVNPHAIRSIDGESYLNDLLQLLEKKSIADKVSFLGVVGNPQDYISDSDVLIFWADSPHFPRPVFEAWMHKKPVIYHNPGFFSKTITDHNTLQLHDTNPEAVGQSLKTIRNSHLFDPATLHSAYVTALETFTEMNFEKIARIYRGLCKR